MTEATVDEVIEMLNADARWHDQVLVAHLVASVAGSRKNVQELIQLMQKLSETRGYSALDSTLAEIETLVSNAVFREAAVEAVVDAMARGVQNAAVSASRPDATGSCGVSGAFPWALREAVMLELRKPSFSESFMPELRTSLSQLRSLVERILDPAKPLPMPAFDGAGSSRAVLARACILAGELDRGRLAPLREAIEDIIACSGLLYGMVPSAMAVLLKGDPSGRTIDAGVRDKLSEPLREVADRVRKARVALDACRGFATFDEDESTQWPLALFLRCWRASRFGAPSIMIDEFAESIAAGDLGKLGALIGGSDPSTIRVDLARLPWDLPRRPGKGTIGLLDISAAVGGAPLRYLLEFFELNPTIDTLHYAIASGDNESIQMIRGRVDERAFAAKRVALARTAANFHLTEVMCWVLKDSQRWERERVRDFARKFQLMDVLSGMANLLHEEDDLFSGSIAAVYGDVLMKWLPDMTSVTLLAKYEGRDSASVDAFIDAAKGRARTLTLIETEGGKSICGAFLEPAWTVGAIDDPSRSSFMFTLKNHLGVFPTKFPKLGDARAAVACQSDRVCFGERACMIGPGGAAAKSGERDRMTGPGGGAAKFEEQYEDAAGFGAAIFHGGDDRGVFRAARWELWETS
jgi:hypothetical protein